MPKGLKFRVTITLPLDFERNNENLVETHEVWAHWGKFCEQVPAYRAATAAQLKALRRHHSSDPDRLHQFNSYYLERIIDDDGPEITHEDIIVGEVQQLSFWVMGPDDMPTHEDPFHSPEEAIRETARWVLRYADQGYYSSARSRIPLADLPDHLRPVEDFIY